MSSINTPMVSVIIPTYNRAQFVKNAIDSVLSQTYDNLEIIVVDDGSQDDTREMLESYKEKIHYIHQENAGVASARNTGVKASTGRWIAFLDSDDKWLPEKIAKQISCVRDTGTKVCFTNVLYDNQNSRWAATPDWESNSWITEKSMDFIVTKKVHLPSMMIERALFDKIGRFNINFLIGEDTELFYKVAFSEDFISYIPEPLVLINRSEQREGLINKSGKSLRMQNESAISILLQGYAHCNNKRASTVRKLRHMLGYQLSRKAEILCVENYYNDARRTAVDALYFGGDFKMCLRCLLIWCFPWFFRLRSKQKYS